MNASVRAPQPLDAGTYQVPAATAGICDDAAVFPPGLAPLPDTPESSGVGPSG